MTRRAPALLLALVAGVAALDPAPGRASDEPAGPLHAARPLVLLVVDGAPGALGRRLEAELEGLGFRVSREALRGRRLGVAAREREARAAVRVHASLSAIEVWVTDGSRTALRDVVVARDDEEQPEAVIALRAVELLRAAFLDIDVELPSTADPTSDAASPSAVAPPSSSAVASAPGPPGSSSAVPTAIPIAPAGSARRATGRPAPEAPARDARAPGGSGGAGARDAGSVEGGAVGVSGALLASAQLGGPTTDAHLLLGARWPFAEVFHAEAWLTTPGVFSGVSRSEGSSSVRTALGGLELGWTSRGRTALVLGTGVSGAWVGARGDPTAGYTAAEDEAWVALALARVGVRHALGERAVLLADVRGALALAPVRVRFAERTVADWGRPLLLPSLGLEVTP